MEQIKQGEVVYVVLKKNEDYNPNYIYTEKFGTLKPIPLSTLIEEVMPKEEILLEALQDMRMSLGLYGLYNEKSCKEWYDKYFKPRLTNK